MDRKALVAVIILTFCTLLGTLFPFGLALVRGFDGFTLVAMPFNGAFGFVIGLVLAAIVMAIPPKRP